jgi:hypothetical protein
MHPSYGWIITAVHDDEDYGPGKKGPRDITPEIEDQLDHGQGLLFQMLTDDGELIYEGRYIGPDDETLFAPLDDYGEPNYGCTVIKYKDDQTGEFVVI